MTYFCCRCLVTDRPIKLTVKADFPGEASARAWLATYFPRMEYQSHEPWTQAKHGAKLSLPMPRHHIRLDLPLGEVAKPNLQKIIVAFSAQPKFQAAPRKPVQIFTR